MKDNNILVIVNKLIKNLYFISYMKKFEAK